MPFSRLLAALLVLTVAWPAMAAEQPHPTPKKWYDRLRLQGYGQVRASSILDGDETLIHDADRSIGVNTAAQIRRARLIFLGDVTDRLFVYIQADLAANIPNNDGNLNFGQLRDIYADVYLTRDRDFRLRVGQSKVPYSFEALQSSQNRLTFERSDALNSAWLAERDVGFQLYWAPKKQRDLFVKLRNAQLKGSGEYGVVALSVVNGQGGNRVEANENVHTMARVAYPLELKNKQIIEAGLAAYTGRFVPRTANVTVAGVSRAVNRGAVEGLRDQRLAGHFVWYPQPFGVQAEYNVGRGPELDIPALTIREERLHGGYIQATYHIQSGESHLFPFVKYQKFDGAKKLEVNAPPTLVREWDFGLEWQPEIDYEVTVVYKTTDRTDTLTFPFPVKSADVLQAQFQVNF